MDLGALSHHGALLSFMQQQGSDSGPSQQVSVMQREAFAVAAVRFHCKGYPTLVTPLQIRVVSIRRLERCWRGICQPEDRQ